MSISYAKIFQVSIMQILNSIRHDIYISISAVNPTTDTDDIIKHVLKNCTTSIFRFIVLIGQAQTLKPD